MTTMYVEHHWDDMSRFGYADVVGKRKHLFEGKGAPIRIDSLERSRQMSSHSSDDSSASSVVEVWGYERLSPSGDRKPLTY